MKEKYIPPLIEVFRLEIENSILETSTVPIKIETIDTIGQESYNVTQDALTHEWK